MPIPSFDQMLAPLLRLATRRDLTRRLAESEMATEFGLTAAELAQRIPSGGSTLVGNRAGWAMTFLTKAGLIAKVAPRTYRATATGKHFLAEHPKVITVKDLKALDGWEEAWQASRSKSDGVVEPQTVKTPAETIDDAVSLLHSEVRNRLLDSILNQSPEFFERLVLDVVLRMGYGGSREEAAEHLGRSGDEGIDGRIKQDALGLDQVFIQAKRYALDRPIDRKTIQAFIGAMAGHGVSKGIFITTSTFAATAQEFVQRGSQTKVVLIDGAGLLDLMLRYRVGVRVERTIELLDLDQNYFEEEM